MLLKKGDAFIFFMIIAILLGYASLPAFYYFDKSSVIAAQVTVDLALPADIEPVFQQTTEALVQTSLKADEEMAMWGETSLLKYSYPKKLDPKQVFLTFDDGPSPNNTPKILEILLSHNVRATFFVIGKSAEAHPELLTQENSQGMAIVAHSYTHNYRLVYSSADSFLQEFQTTNTIIHQATGREPLLLTRWPGGSDNRVSSAKVRSEIKNLLKEKGIKYLDWNVDSTDGSGLTVPAARILDNVVRQLKDAPFAVILFHDAPAKVTTVEALPAIIQYLQEQGYVFRTFDDVSFEEEEEMLRLGIMKK